MDKDKQEIARELRILERTERSGHVARTCGYFGIGRASFHRWQAVYRAGGEAALVNAKPLPKNPTYQTPPEITEKVLHLRRTYHLGSIRG